MVQITEKERNRYTSLTVERLKEVLSFNPDTGIFTWRISPAKNIKPGTIAGNDTGWYVRINIDGCPYLAHRLAWFYIHEYWPSAIDHINGAVADNRIINLREVTISQNNCNRQPCGASGIKGVRYRNGAYEANIKINGTSIYLGRFETLQEATRIYKEKAKEVFGEFAGG